MKSPLHLFLLLLLFTVGCASQYQGVSVVNNNVEPSRAFPTDIESVEVKGANLPAFLGPIVVSNLSVAIAELGITPVFDDAQVVVTVRFNSVPVGDTPSQSQNEDGFLESIEHSSETRFIAQLIVEARRKNESDIFWSGTIQKHHVVGPGDYMHTGPASPAILNAFRALLAGSE